MQYYSIYSENRLTPSAGHASCLLLGAEQGCPGGCAAGISIYASQEFAPSQTHPFHEGFFVAEGHGIAIVGSEIFNIQAGMSFFVPKGTEHSIRCCGENPVKVFWFHSS